MQPSLPSRKGSKAPEPDKTLVPRLQDLSRRLDMSASSAIGDIRKELRLLISEGRIAPPDPISLRSEQLSTSNTLRLIALGEHFDSLESPAKGSSPRKIAKKVPEAQRSQEEWGVDTMTTPELSNFLSELIRFHGSLSAPRSKK